VETKEPREEFKKLEDCGFGESGLVPSVDGLWERKELEGGEVENSRLNSIVARQKRAVTVVCKYGISEKYNTVTADLSKRGQVKRDREVEKENASGSHV
jgi:hypothetical protein